MALTAGNIHGALNGTTPVTIVAAPSVSQQVIIRTITFYNADTAAVTITLRYTDGATQRIIAKFTLGVGETFIFGDRGEALVLDATTKSITALMSAAAAATNPDFTSNYATEG